MFTDSDYAAWVEAVTGVLGLLIAIITLLQSKRIKELTDVTDAIIKQNNELKKQTSELEKQSILTARRFEIEKALSVEKRMPVFQYAGSEYHPLYRSYSISIKNIGRDAFNLSLIVDNPHFFTPIPPKKCDHMETIILRFVCKQGADIVIEELATTFFFQNNYGHESSQNILKEKGSVDFSISVPVTPF